MHIFIQATLQGANYQAYNIIRWPSACTCSAVIVEHNYLWISSAIEDYYNNYYTGFAEDQFNNDNPMLGNRVTLVDNEYTIICDVETYYSSTSQVVCRTRYVLYMQLKYMHHLVIIGLPHIPMMLTLV